MTEPPAAYHAGIKQLLLLAAVYVWHRAVKPLTGCAVVHERLTSPSYMQLERKKNDLYSTHQLPLLLSFFLFNRAIFFRVLAPDFYRPYALPVI